MRADFLGGEEEWLIQGDGQFEAGTTIEVPYRSTGYFEVVTGGEWTIDLPELVPGVKSRWRRGSLGSLR